MDIAASSSSAPTTETPAIEKAREKQRRKINESISGLKPEHQIDFLIARLAESRVGGEEQKKETDQLKKETGKLNTKLDATQKMLGKTELAKAKLEQLCRELSKQQREEKEQNQLRLKQMQTVHADTVDSFKKSLGDIQQNMADKQEYTKRVADVERLSNDFNQMATDYETRVTALKKLYEERERDLGKAASTKEKEVGMMRTAIDDMQKRVNEVFTENVTLKKELLGKERQLKESNEAEIAMRKVLDDYTRKYGELTRSLDSSNVSFDKVKDQMSKMNGNLIKVQADSKKWKEKAEEANKVAAALSLEKVEFQKSLALKDRQLSQMQELCRRLQKDQQPPPPEYHHHHSSSCCTENGEETVAVHHDNGELNCQEVNQGEKPDELEEQNAAINGDPPEGGEMAATSMEAAVAEVHKKEEEE